MNAKNIFNLKRLEIYNQLKNIGLDKEECLAEARILLEHVTAISEAQQLTSDLLEFPAQWQEKIISILNARKKRKPLAYCLGKVQFGGLDFKIAPGVLIPRSDTETLVEAILACVDKNAQLNIAEIGIGSGIIAISLLKRLVNCSVWACDISDSAIQVASENAEKHGVQNRLTLVHGNWTEVMPGNFDVIVSNPPYISRNASLQPEIAFEPNEALFAGEDGLDFYHQFARILPTHYRLSTNVSKKPLGAFEIGDGQSTTVMSIFTEHGWKNIDVKKDIHGLPRVLLAEPPIIKNSK